MSQPKKILFAGGGTGGPVIPLLAVAEEIKKMEPDAEFLFVGTKNSPEKELVEGAGFKFISIPAAKFRRYLSLSNISDFFVFLYSLVKARKIMNQFQPDIVVGAGGFVAVPFSWLAKLRKVKIALHQQDAEIGLANRLISPFATLITTAFEKTAKDFYSDSGFSKQSLKPTAVWVGNPVRPEFFRPAHPETFKKFGLNNSLPILLIFGGATGATQINDVVTAAMPELVKAHQVIHITGRNKNKSVFTDPNYHSYEFIGTDIADVMKISDIVLARAGLSTIAELSALGKISIVVPIANSHQEQNAQILKQNSAAVVLNKLEFNPDDLPRIVNSLKFNVERQKLLKRNIAAIMPHDAAVRIANLILEHVRK